MTDDHDEPLEGDIGPAARPASSASPDASPEPADELRRYEEAREERRRRTNAVSGRIALIAVAMLLGFLAYDSVATALEARRRGDPWVYPPAVVAGLCLAGLAALAAVAARRTRRRERR